MSEQSLSYSRQGQLDLSERRYFTIGEVAKICNVKPHVLRYWEQEFTQLKPAKRRGNRRYYQSKDVDLIKQIYRLLYQEGYTISGARQFISQSIKQDVSQPLPISNQVALQETISELEDILSDLGE